LGEYKATLQGQATAIRDVMDAVAHVPNDRGLGVFYWEPIGFRCPALVGKRMKETPGKIRRCSISADRRCVN